MRGYVCESLAVVSYRSICRSLEHQHAHLLVGPQQLFKPNAHKTQKPSGVTLFLDVAMSYNSAQHRSRSNPPPTHRSQLPTLHHLARPDAYRKDTAPSPTTPTQQYQQFGEPIRQSTHISYPTRLISDSGSSDSERALLEQPQTHSTLRRRPTGKRKTSVTSAVASDALLGSRHRRRGSGPEDLALLETHILPSLSKTIDRMTNVKAQVPSLQTPDLNDNSVLPLPKSSRMQSKLPTVKPSSQPSTPRPILKSSMRSPITPTISSFTPANSSLRSVKGFSPSPRLQGYFDDLTPTFSPTSLLSERPPTYLSPQGQVPDTSALYNSTPKTPSRKQTISQQPSSRPSHATTNYIPHRPKSPDHTLDHTAEQASLPLPLLSPIIAERPPWDEVLSEAWHLGSRLSHNSTNMRPQKSAVSPQKEEFHPSERTHEVHHGSHNNPSDYPPYGDNAALQRKRRETLLAIVEGVNAQFDTGAPTRESSEYSGHVGLAIGSRESTFGEGMASLHRPPSADQHSQGSGKGWRRSSASSASREGNTGEERPSRYERTPSSNSPRIGHDTDHAYQERKGCSPNRDPVTPPPEPNPDARISRRSPVRNSSEPTRPVRAPTPPDYLYQSHREQKRRSVSTPPVVRRSKIDLVQNGKKREAGSLLPRTRSSLFLPTDAKVSRPTSGDGLDAFGLPPSLSYVFKDASGHAGITPAESGKSLEDRTECWKKDLDVRKVPEDFLSNGAEKLFQSLVDEDTSRGSNGSSRSPRHFSQASPTPARRTSMPTARSDFSIASMSSAPSVYDDLAEEYEGDNERRFLAPPNPQPSASHVPPSWRSSISPSVYNSFVRLYGEIEMQRQEVIFDICRTEALFVQRLRTALRLFIRPLRAQDTSTWISGVPWSVARLFDWFEDILNLHVEINVELRQARSDPQAVVERFAGMLRKFVPRFEVYQPYIMRLEGVLGQLKGEGDNDTDGNWANFREFVSIQELEEGCEGWSLQSLLLEPIHRSSECVEMLQVRCFCPSQSFRLTFGFEVVVGEDIKTTRGSFIDSLSGVLNENDVPRYSRG